MATESLQIRITAELSQIRAALQGLQGQLDKVRTSGERAAAPIAGGIGQLNDRLRTGMRLAAGLAASIGASMSIAGLIRASDEATLIAARLRLATKDAQAFETAQRGVFEIAQRTRTSLLATVDLYARIERSTREQKVNQATILQLTETINQAAQISGGGPGSEAALFQLSQGLAAGTLRGEELNSVLEQTPRLAQAIADGMNLPIGKLRQIAEDGKLTSEAVLRALLSQSAQIQREFAEFPPTISSGFTQIRNALVQYLATSQEAGSAARSFAEALATIARNLPTIIDYLIRLGPVALAAFAGFKIIPAITATVILLGARLQALSGAALLGARGAIIALASIRVALLGLIAVFAGWQIGSLLREQFLEVRLFGIAMVNGLMKSLEALRGAFRVTGIAIREAFASAFNFVLDRAAGFYDSLAAGAERLPGIGDRISTAYRNAAADLRGSKMEAEGLVDAVKRVSGETTDAMREIDRLTGEMADAEIARQAAQGGAGAAPTGEVGIPPSGGAAGKASKEAAALAQINADLVQDAVRRALEQLDRLYEDGKISIREYFAEKRRLELEGIDAAIAAAEAERAAATKGSEVAAAQATIVKLLRDRQAAVEDTARAQTKAEEEYTRQLGALQIRLLQAQGETGRAARAQLEEELREFLIRAQAEGDTAGYNLARKVINVEAFEAQLAQADARVSEAVSRMQSVETSTGAQVEAGLLAQSDAEERLRQQREASLAILIQQRDAVMAVAAEARLAGDALTMDKANAKLDEINGQIATMSINTASLGYQAAQVLKGALTQLFTDLASGSKSAGDALRDFVLNFIQGMAQIAANALATYLVLQLLDAIYPGLGKATAALTAASAGTAHSGGIAGQSGTRRILPPWTFAGAPRMHTGGIAGLGPDETAIVAKKGEEILTRQDRRHRDNGGLDAPAGAGGAQLPRPVVVFGEDQLADALKGHAGEKLVIHHVRNNKELLLNDPG